MTILIEFDSIKVSCRLVWFGCMCGQKLSVFQKIMNSKITYKQLYAVAAGRNSLSVNIILNEHEEEWSESSMV